jgi:CheY-like chemotaxis protein
MKALGEMASGVAHNFNNMLQVIMGGAQLAMMNLDAGKPNDVKKVLEQILESSRLGSDTVKWLQEFAGVRAHKAPDPNASFDLSEIVGAAIEISRQWWEVNPEEHGARISLRQSLRPSCQVQGNDEEVFETTVNLIRHAVEALVHGGEIFIRTMIEGDRGVLRVENNSPDLSEKDRSRLLEQEWNFEPTSPLANSLTRLSKQQIDVSIEEMEDSGMSYTFRFHLAGAKAMIPEAKKDHSVIKPLRVLIIDDIEAILTTVQHGLTHLGHKALCASSGEEGLTILKETEVDAIVCDLGMPHMNGWDVGRRLKELSEATGTSKTPFILMTGWGGQVLSDEKTARCGVDLIVEKPVRIPQLVQAISEIKDKSHGN